MPRFVSAPAVRGAAALVPPTTSHPPAPRVVYTAIPVPGSATAATSPSMRIEQPVSFCQAGCATYGLHPRLERDHVVRNRQRMQPVRGEARLAERHRLLEVACAGVLRVAEGGGDDEA